VCVEYCGGGSVVDEVCDIGALSTSLYFRHESRSFPPLKLQECAWSISKRFGNCVVVCDDSTRSILRCSWYFSRLLGVCWRKW
jgi:hypothetical protein